jgi:ankyrin repeat protein
MDCISNSILRLISEVYYGSNKYRDQISEIVDMINIINSPEFVNKIKESLMEDYNGVGDSIFMAAIQKSATLKIALSLLNNGLVNPEYTNDKEETPLILAIKYKHPEVAIDLIKTNKSLPNQIDNNGYTALLYACKIGKPMEKVAVELIKTGQSLPEYINPNENKSAIDYMKKENMNLALNEITAQTALNVASAVRLRTNINDISPQENKKGYRDAQGNINPSAPTNIEKSIQGFLNSKMKAGKTRRNKRKNRKSRKQKK